MVVETETGTGTGKCRDGEIAEVLTHTWVARQQRFVTLKSCDDMRECPNPRCHALMRGDRRKPQMTCHSCGTHFCFHHANAHPPYVSCRQFVSRGRKEERLSRGTIKRIAKRCPNRNCRAPTEKNGGVRRELYSTDHLLYVYYLLYSVSHLKN